MLLGLQVWDVRCLDFGDVWCFWEVYLQIWASGLWYLLCGAGRYQVSSAELKPIR